MRTCSGQCQGATGSQDVPNIRNQFHLCMPPRGLEWDSITTQILEGHQKQILTTQIQFARNISTHLAKTNIQTVLSKSRTLPAVLKQHFSQPHPSHVHHPDACCFFMVLTLKNEFSEKMIWDWDLKNQEQTQDRLLKNQETTGQTTLPDPSPSESSPVQGLWHQLGGRLGRQGQVPQQHPR